MRREVLLAWQNETKRCVSESLRSFVLQSTRYRPDQPGLLKFEWHARKQLWCFIAFRLLDSEAFDVYAGWATSSNVPVTVVTSGTEKTDFSAPCYFDLSIGFVPRQGAAFWSFWESSDRALDDPGLFAKEYSEHFLLGLSEDEAVRLVSPSIHKAMDEVLGYCLPYLESRVAYEDRK